MSILDDWEIVIGLEIHAELNTKSKLFSCAPNRFGDEPNTNISEVCTGQPGALPVLNEEAVKKAVSLGCALGSDVQKFSKFDRKSYFYPDSPRNFQITQFEEPIVLGGTVIAEVNGKDMVFEIDRVHLEDDAGMLKHFSTFAGVDYNRAGVPLVEIVSKPCIHSADEAKAYAMAIKAILEYIDASDCNMEEGSLRFDANVSVRKKGETTLRNKIEIKNMNSFTNMGLAIDSEVKRQIRTYMNNPDTPHDELIHQETYRWDPDLGEAIMMRRKEHSNDYRYFPEPDLVPILLTDAYINEIREALPELPLQRERRYVEDYQLSTHHAFIITSDKKVADFFEEALKGCQNAKSLCNWIIIEFPGRLKEKGLTLPDTKITPEHLGKLVNMIDTGKITGRIAKEVADDLVESPGKDPEEIVASNPDYQAVHDQGEIEKLVDQVLSENQDSVESFKNGKDKAFSFLVGQVMKLSRGKANPQMVNQLLNEKIASHCP